MHTGAIFIDLTKAFDMVDHYLLLDKLYAIGLSQHSSFWFNAYLHNRRQCVSYWGIQSDFMIMEKGVTQGSNLGPLLFSICINDLPQVCADCHIQLYADDTVIYCSKPDISQTQNSLQADFDANQKLLSFNKLLLNKKKSYRMLFTTRANSLHLNNWSINFLDRTPLEKVEEFEYLGIWLDSHLSFKAHIESVVKKMNCSLRILYRSTVLPYRSGKELLPS